MEFHTPKNGSADFTARKTETGVRFAHSNQFSKRVMLRHHFDVPRSKSCVKMETTEFFLRREVTEKKRFEQALLPGGLPIFISKILKCQQLQIQNGGLEAYLSVYH